MNASSTEMTRKTAISTRMISISFLSEHFFRLGLMRSIVSVELEVSTSEDRVDIDAESTSTTTRPIRMSSRDGIMASKSGLPLDRVEITVLPLPSSVSVQNNRSKPPSR